MNHFWIMSILWAMRGDPRARSLGEQTLTRSDSITLTLKTQSTSLPWLKELITSSLGASLSNLPNNKLSLETGAISTNPLWLSKKWRALWASLTKFYSKTTSQRCSHPKSLLKRNYHHKISLTQLGSTGGGINNKVRRRCVSITIKKPSNKGLIPIFRQSRRKFQGLSLQLFTLSGRRIKIQQLRSLSLKAFKTKGTPGSKETL
jgi:hypothetical protein